MQTIERGYRGLELLVRLNTDRILVLVALSGALLLADYLASLQ